MQRVDLHLRPMGILTTVIPLASAVLLLAVGLGIIQYGTRNYVHESKHNAMAKARILASTEVAALAFDDPKAGQEYVDAMAADPDIRIASVYFLDGRRFAAYSAEGMASVPQIVPPEGTSIGDDRLGVVVPAVQAGRHLGWVYLRTVIESSTRRMIRFGITALLVGLTGLVLMVLATSQRALAKANDGLRRSNADLKMQIEGREKAEAALRQAQKMEAIGQLTGGVAHDFNNLLQVILGSLHTLRARARRWNLDEAVTNELVRWTDAAMSGSNRAAALTRQLLAFSRRQPLDPKPIDANKLVSGMSGLLRRTLGETVSIETILAGGLWPVFADPNQLESALLNLGVNARDAMPQGGKLTIETANAYLDEAYVRDYEELAAGQYVVIAVSDTGTGMDREVLAKAFEPFFTTKDIGRGTGLGLSQVYGFAKQSGGHAKIYSESGQGTTVKLYLPRHVADQAEQGSEDAHDLPRAARGDAILVVEDEENVRIATIEMLRELGYTVFEAGDGQQALTVLDRVANIRLLFTDVGLPGGMTGRQLADEAQRRRPTLKVLFTTGYARNAIVHHGRLDPGVSLIGKPFSYEALAEKLKEVLRE